MTPYPKFTYLPTRTQDVESAKIQFDKQKKIHNNKIIDMSKRLTTIENGIELHEAELTRLAERKKEIESEMDTLSSARLKIMLKALELGQDTELKQLEQFAKSDTDRIIAILPTLNHTHATSIINDMCHPSVVSRLAETMMAIVKTLGLRSFGFNPTRRTLLHLVIRTGLLNFRRYHKEETKKYTLFKQASTVKHPKIPKDLLILFEHTSTVAFQILTFLANVLISNKQFQGLPTTNPLVFRFDTLSKYGGLDLNVISETITELWYYEMGRGTTKPIKDLLDVVTDGFIHQWSNELRRQTQLVSFNRYVYGVTENNHSHWHINSDWLSTTGSQIQEHLTALQQQVAYNGGDIFRTAFIQSLKKSCVQDFSRIEPASISNWRIDSPLQHIRSAADRMRIRSAKISNSISLMEFLTSGRKEFSKSDVSSMHRSGLKRIFDLGRLQMGEVEVSFGTVIVDFY